MSLFTPLPFRFVSHLCRPALSGCAPDRAVTFLCFAQRKSPKVTEWDFAHFAPRSYAKAKWRAEVRAPSGYLALLVSGGVGLNSLRSNNARPDPPAAALLSPATRHRGPDSREPTAQDRTAKQGRAMARPCGLGIRFSVPYCRERRRVAQARAEKEAQMSERSEFLRFPPSPSNAACPERSGGTTNPARLLFAYFLLAKQEKVSALPGAHPGNAPHASALQGAK